MSRARQRLRTCWLLPAGLLWIAVGLATAAGRSPVVKAGPYTVTIEQIIHSRSTTLYYRLPKAARQPPSRVNRAVQIHLRVDSPDAGAAAGLGVLRISRFRVRAGGKSVDAPHFGGKIDAMGGEPLVRAYLYVPSLQASVHRIDLIEGELIAFEPSFDLKLVWKPQEDALPRTQDTHGIKVTLLSLKRGGTTALLRFRAEAPPGMTLVVPADVPYHGVSLWTGKRRTGTFSTGNVRVLAPNLLEYELAFSRVREPLDEIRLRLAARGGRRHSYPFRFRDLPIPERPLGSAGK